MNEFLNSFAFEQMVREYNKRYGINKVETLSLLNDEYFEKEITKIYDDVFNLLGLLENAFRGNFNLKKYFEGVNELKLEAKQTYKNLFFKEYNQNKDNGFNKNINHKICVIEMINIIKNIFVIEKKFIDKIFLSNDTNINKEKDMFLFKDLQKIFEKIIKSFKDFYAKI